MMGGSPLGVVFGTDLQVGDRSLTGDSPISRIPAEGLLLVESADRGTPDWKSGDSDLGRLGKHNPVVYLS